MSNRDEPGLPAAQIHARGLGGRVRRWSAKGRYLRATYGLFALSGLAGIGVWYLRAGAERPPPRIVVPGNAPPRPISSLSPSAPLGLDPPATVPATAATIVPGALIYYRDDLSLDGRYDAPWSAGIVDTVNPSGTFTIRGDDQVRTIATARVLAER